MEERPTAPGQQLHCNAVRILSHFDGTGQLRLGESGVPASRDVMLQTRTAAGADARANRDQLFVLLLQCHVSTSGGRTDLSFDSVSANSASGHNQ
jgi:hypothetical protein